MSKHRLVYYPDPILRGKAETVDKIDKEIKKLVELMQTITIDNNGAGLAAPQAAESIRLFITPVIGSHRKTQEPYYANRLDEWTICINPQILSYSEETTNYEEGCISIPKLFLPIRRPRKVRVTFYDLNGELIEKELDHWFARVFLHEYDHIEGRLFTDYPMGLATNGYDQNLSFETKLKISSHLFNLEKKQQVL